MIVVHAEVFAQVPQREAARAAMLAAESGAREEPGCVSYDFSEALVEPGRFLAVEVWADRAALDAHFAGASFERYQQEIGPLLVRDSEVRIYEVVSATRPLDSSPLDLRQDD